MDTQCCFINGARSGIGAEIATTPSDARTQIAATACQPEAVRKALRFSNKLLNVAPDATSQHEIKRAASLPIVAVVFTLGGPVVYQP